MRKVLTILMLMTSLSLMANDPLLSDSLAVSEQPPKENWFKRTLRKFTEIDTSYVEPQHYNWAFMLQGTYNYDIYRLSTSGENEQKVTFAPAPTFKFGPYFGWRWIFLGYTIDLKSLSFSSTKQEFDFSFYAAQVGIDLFYRRTGSDYMIRNVDFGKEVNTAMLEDVSFDGLSVGITGFNAYYIFNHKRFSYPAAFNQSTMQKISCGSWMAGLGYMRNKLAFDYDKMQDLMSERLSDDVKLDSGLMFNSVKYYNVNASVGYAYNWVFARNCLFCSSLSMALAYKKTRGETIDEDKKGFNLKNFNVDGIGRFGIVWNNNKWYAGASAIVRLYNYHTSRFSANNIFGSLNIYAGFNFGSRKGYK